MTAKQTSALVLALAIGVVLAGCGSSQQAAPASSAGTGSGQQSATAAASPAARLGEQIFTTGSAADGTPIAITAGAGGPCAKCHGADAKGNIGPDIRWSVLTGTGSSSRAPRFTLSSEAQFTDTVTKGVAAGNQLRQLMPHYNLTPEQVSGLVAYLKTLQ